MSDEQFAAAVRRNIKTLLAMHDMEQQDLATPAGFSSPAVLSSRMTTGKSRSSWRDAELLNIARVLDVTLEVVTSLTEADFRDALARSRCTSSFAEVSDVEGPYPGQGVLALAS